MNKIFLDQYDLKMTLLGGQAFNFDFFPEENCYYGFTQKKIIKLKSIVGNGRDHSLWWQTYPEKDDFNFLKSYLRLDVDFPRVLKKIQKDKHIKNAIKKYPGLRLLKQDFDQTLLSFLISSVNNISSIRSSVRMMARKFGKKINLDRKEIFLFPETAAIANAKHEELLECKLGFRAKYLKSCAQNLLKNNLSFAIKNMNEFEARKNLTALFGVGEKIADCVLVFSLGHDSVTPLDVWGKRVLIEFYGVNSKMKYESMRKWISNYFGNYTSWAGQYLYEYIRD